MGDAMRQPNLRLRSRRVPGPGTHPDQESQNHRAGYQNGVLFMTGRSSSSSCQWLFGCVPRALFLGAGVIISTFYLRQQGEDRCFSLQRSQLSGSLCHVGNPSPDHTHTARTPLTVSHLWKATKQRTNQTWPPWHALRVLCYLTSLTAEQFPKSIHWQL